MALHEPLARSNRIPGICIACRKPVAAGEGRARKAGRRWSVEHRPVRWTSGPLAGSYTSGCPKLVTDLADRFDATFEVATGSCGPVAAAS